MSTKPRTHNRHQKGYSLLELSIVLSLLASFLLIAVLPVRTALERQETTQFLNQFTSDLQRAASEARTKMVTIDVHILNKDHLVLFKVNSVYQKQLRIPSGMSMKSNYPKNKIKFYADGQVSQAGTIDLIGRDNQKYHVVIQLSSGRMVVRRS